MAVHFKEDWESLAGRAGFSARRLAMISGLSLRQLQRIFHKQFARSPQDWLNERRLASAQGLLLSGKPVKAVAFELGFKQVSHFCRQFKQLNKLTPSDFVQIYARAETGCRSQITNVALG